jgi:hypothetical protein
MSDKTLYPPDSVRVWRGFQLPDLTIDKFCEKLGTVFVPATVKMQIDIGLQAYAPTIPAGLASKPAEVPDETAVLFWESPDVYWNGFSTLAARTYTLTHNGCYVMTPIDDGQPKSRADFPVLFSGSLKSEQSVFLFSKPADWMSGSIRHIVGARPAAQEESAFLSSVAGVLSQIQASIALEGAIACVGKDYLVYWELGLAAPGMQNPPTGIPLLEKVLDWNHSFSPAPTYIPIGLWDVWAGMDVVSGSSFNMQFSRREKP